MQITIEVKDSALDKIMYFLNHLKSDVKIIEKLDTNSFKIEALSKNEDDYKHILNGRKERKESPQNYGTLDDIK
ncbi:MAG: hypothetical protein PHQ93_08745 [Sulfurimonas sp.]|uniref:hypothetical protein n=1 Tax=Sulfurimonas sp. TaxID=2022749 RepID=UPI00260A9C02|nr:hypothetical protein [Sulfurimonas sp.]MDD5401258.1 hypothetical protein [Sulfurimonas sp.]